MFIKSFFFFGEVSGWPCRYKKDPSNI